MRKLLIVDDEHHVVDWLYEMFSLESGLVLDLYKAYTAREALKVLERIKIDVVLSDIKMPGMSGLELARHISRKWPLCKIIFLTGVQSFDYIYQAEKYPSSIYLMKTEDDDVIVRTVKNQLDQIENDIRNRKMLEETTAKSALLEQSVFLQQVAGGKAGPPQAIQAGLRELGIPIDITAPVLIVSGQLTRAGSAPGLKHYFSIYPIIQKYISHMMHTVQWTEGGSCIFWLLQPMGEAHPDPLNIRDILEDVQSSCSELLGVGISFALGSEYVDFRELPLRSEKLKNLVCSHLFHQETVIMMDGPGWDLGEEWKAPAIDLQMREFLETAILRGGGRDTFFSALEEALSPLKNIGSMHHSGAIELYLSVALLLLHQINRLNLQKHLAFRVGLYKLTRLDSFENWEDAVGFLKEVASGLFESQTRREESYRLQAIDSIKDYITRNIGGDLSLAAIADRMNYNPSYISRMFKQLERVNLSDFIVQTRLARAKELLCGGNKSINEIAVTVGFDSPQYFATVFRKHTGLSPNQYRLEGL